MKVILDTNIWISFLIGHQAQLLRRVLTDVRFNVSEASPSAVRDPKDLYLLSLAETIGADYIVSGDADLTDLGQHRQTRIVKLADFKVIMLYI